MNLYRIACKFDPALRRMMGSVSDGSVMNGQTPVVRQGIWRVVWCIAFPPEYNEIFQRNLVEHQPGDPLFVTACRPMQRGSLCNPRKLLAEYFEKRTVNQVRAEMRREADALFSEVKAERSPA